MAIVGTGPLIDATRLFATRERATPADARGGGPIMGRGRSCFPRTWLARWAPDAIGHDQSQSQLPREKLRPPEVKLPRAGQNPPASSYSGGRARRKARTEIAARPRRARRPRRCCADVVNASLTFGAVGHHASALSARRSYALSNRSANASRRSAARSITRANDASVALSVCPSVALSVGWSLSGSVSLAAS